jgi:hypothetical protein
MSSDPDRDTDAEQAEGIDQEEATPLPTREVMSIIDPSAAARLFPSEPIDPATTTGQGINERWIGKEPPEPA